MSENEVHPEKVFFNRSQYQKPIQTITYWMSYSQTNPFDGCDGDGDQSNNSHCYWVLLYVIIFLASVDIRSWSCSSFDVVVVAALVGVFVGK